jgi:hypothetical protein
VGAGCGARTGLPVPDLGPDAGVDMGMDMGMDAEVPCLEIPFDGGIVEVELETEARVGRADVVFLIDRTLSMSAEIDRIRDRLRDRIAPAIREAIPDSQVAVASFADFPIADYGTSEDGDTPFTLHSSSSAAIESAQGAVDSIRLSNGLDRRESQVEALYQVATGAGIGSFVQPSVGCPSGGIGYACMRTDALPVIMLFTDAQFHQDPFESGSNYRRHLAHATHVGRNAGRARRHQRARARLRLGRGRGGAAPETPGHHDGRRGRPRAALGVRHR